MSETFLLLEFLISYLKNDLQLDRGAQRKARHTIDQSARIFIFSEDVLQQFRSCVSDFRLIANIARSRHRHAEANDP